MRGASRETYRAASDKLTELARASDAAATAKAGDELLSVAGLLQREPRLRRALADPSRSGKDRAALLDGLVKGSAGDETRSILGAAAGGRWSSPNELLDGIEQLGVDALLASADRAGDLGEIEDELFRFGQVVDGSPQLAAVLADTTVPIDVRASVVDSLLDGKAKPVTVRLARLSLAGFGGRTFTGALTRLVELAAERRDMQVAYVTVAKALTDDEEQRIGARLAAMYGREVSVKVTVDPEVLGGARILIGSDLYDGTTLRRLIDARHAVTGK
jgi:F-type H+-transporting ATPase subunit delta